MDDSAFQPWWELHVRVARGDSLAPEEQAIYEATRVAHDHEEQRETLWNARQAKQELRELESECSRLEERRRQLDDEISSLEKRLGQPTRQLLGTEE